MKTTEEIAKEIVDESREFTFCIFCADDTSKELYPGIQERIKSALDTERQAREEAEKKLKNTEDEKIQIENALYSICDKPHQDRSWQGGYIMLGWDKKYTYPTIRNPVRLRDEENSNLEAKLSSAHKRIEELEEENLAWSKGEVSVSFIHQIKKLQSKITDLEALIMEKDLRLKRILETSYPHYVGGDKKVHDIAREALRLTPSEIRSQLEEARKEIERLKGILEVIASDARKKADWNKRTGGILRPSLESQIALEALSHAEGEEK